MLSVKTPVALMTALAALIRLAVQLIGGLQAGDLAIGFDQFFDAAVI